jgi:hypothetical protein
VVIDVEETEEKRIVREEAADLMRIGSIKRALRSKSGRAPRAVPALALHGALPRRACRRGRLREVHTAAARPRSPGDRRGGEAPAHYEPPRVPCRQQSRDWRRQQPRRAEHPAGPVGAVAVLPVADVLGQAPGVGIAVV